MRSVAELKHGGFSVSPGIEWKSGARGVSVAHKFRAGTLRGSYAHDSQTGGLEYDFKPFKVIPQDRGLAPEQETLSMHWRLNLQALQSSVIVSPSA